MLVLARKPNQSIMIGDDIEIQIVDVKGDQVKIGITAPQEIPVHRKEIYIDIQLSNVSAAKSSPKPQQLSTIRKMFDKKAEHGSIQEDKNKSKSSEKPKISIKKKNKS